MKISSKILTMSVILALFGISLLPTVKGSTVPTWLPKQGDLNGYNLRWQGNQSIENFICGEKAENYTIYSQVWYKNATPTTFTAIIGEGFLDFGSDVMGQNIDTEIKAGMLFVFPAFKGSTNWDLMVFFLNNSLGTMKDIKSELPSWSRAMELNWSTNDYMIFGTAGTKLIISFSFDIDAGEWIDAYDSEIAMAFGGLVTAFVSMFAAFASYTKCPSSSSVELTATVATTPRSEMIAFNTEVGETVNPSSSGIPGYPLAITAMFSILTVAIIIKKKQH